MSHLDTFLASMTSDVALTLSRITSSKVIQRVCKRGFKRFLETYRKLYEDIQDPNNGYGNTVKLRSVGEMETLLSL
jgi:hypothetical protein